MNDYFFLTVPYQCFANKSRKQTKRSNLNPGCNKHKTNKVQWISRAFSPLHYILTASSTGEKDSKREKGEEASPTCCLQLSSNHFKNKHMHTHTPPLHANTHTVVQTTPPIMVVHCKSWSPAPEPCRGLRVPLQKLHSRPPITMRMDGNPPSLNTHTYTHTPGRTTTLADNKTWSWTQTVCCCWEWSVLLQYLILILMIFVSGTQKYKHTHNTCVKCESGTLACYF